MSSSAYIEYQVRPPSAFDPAFLDEISESEMSTNMNNMKSGNGREDFLSSFGIEDVELDEHEQAMMQHQLQHQYRQAQQQQQQQYLQQQQQHYLPPSPARSSASTASLVSQRSAAAKRSTGAAPRSRAHSNNSVNKNNDNLRMPVSFDEETELLQEELGYDFVAGKDVLSGRGQKVKVLNTHYRDLIRKYHPEYVAAGFGGKRRKLAEAICSQIFSAGGRFLDFKGQPMTEQQCQQKIMKALKDFSKKGKSAAAAAAAVAAASGSTSSSAPKAKTESTTTPTSSPKPPTQTCSGSSKATRRNSVPGSAPITSNNNTTAGPHIVSPAQSVRHTVLPPTLKEQQREPSPTPTSSGICLRAASPSTPSVLMLESDDEDGVVSSPTQVSSSNSSVVGSSNNNNRYYFDPPPLASDVPYETAAAFRVEPSSPSSVRKTTMTPTSSVSDVGTPKRQKTMHNPPPPPPQYSYYQQHPHYHQYQQYPAQQYHHQQQQAYLPHPYTMVNRVTPVSLQPPSVARRVTLPMAAAPTRGGNVQHQFRAPSPPPFPSSGTNSSSSNNSHHQRQHALFANSNDSRNNNSGDIEPLPLTARLDMEDADACLQMLDDLVHPDDYP